MSNKFNKGDVVVMKSGGPPMTIDEVPGEDTRSYPHKTRTDYACRWFKGASKEHGDFQEHLLETYTAPTKK